VPGMNSGLDPNDPVIVAAFRSALLHQGGIALAVVVFLLLLWATARTWRTAPPATTGMPAAREVPARRLLRIGFGLIWILDGLLQAQPKMAAGLPSLVIAPTAASSPSWVQHVVNWAGTIWSYHPIQAGAASVWIQIGIGAWLLVAVRGPWSRLAGAASVSWGLIVWVFGEAFGGIFTQSLSFLSGAPGAVLIYVVAGALIAMPEKAWRSPRLGRLLLGGIGLFFVGMAILQAWPGRGFWQGGKNGSLTGMIGEMASTPQPHYLHQIVSGAESFSAAHGWAVNLFAVIVLAALGLLFLSGRRWLIRYAVWFGVFFCLADWLLVQDLGFLGGVGTDPNSMIPMILLFGAGYLALTPEQPEAEAAAEVPEAVTETTPEEPRVPRLGVLRDRLASASAQSLAIASAIVVLLIGAAPMAAAAANRTADPIIAEAISGDSALIDSPAPDFTLTDQNGHTVTMASLRGKVILLTFLDPVCTTDCPIIGAEFKEAGVLLGSADPDVELVAIAANPVYYSIADDRAFDTEAGLTTVPNWRYLTGSLPQLEKLWNQYGVDVENLPAGAMAAHNDIAIVISKDGQIIQELSADPGPATTSSQSSYSVLLADDARQALAGS
jgi:cytochrome oxidase Cu insertion factor (SCO1/SenC/PrrC family)